MTSSARAGTTIAASDGQAQLAAGAGRRAGAAFPRRPFIQLPRDGLSR